MVYGHHFKLSLITLSLLSFNSQAAFFLDGGTHEVTESIYTQDSKNYPLYVLNGTTIFANDGLVFSSEADLTHAVFIQNQSELTFNNITLLTKGKGAAGIYADDSTVTMTGGSITTADGNGINAINSSVNLKDVAIDTGRDSAGIYADQSAVVMTGGSITTTDGDGINAINSSVNLKDVKIDTGRDSAGIYAEQSAVVMTGGSITTADGDGINAINSSVNLKDVMIDATKATGIHMGCGLLTADNVQIKTTDGLIGIELLDSEAEMTAVKINTAGNAKGIQVDNSGAQATTLTNSTITTADGIGLDLLNGDVTLRDTSIASANNHAVALSGENSSFTATGGTFSTTGADASAFTVAKGSMVNLTNADITTTGTDAYAIDSVGFDALSPNRVTLDNTRLTAQNSDLIHTAGSRLDLNLANGTTLTGLDYALNAQTDAAGVDSDVRVIADNNVNIQGNVRADAGSKLALDLRNASTLAGAATNVDTIAVDATSKWLISDNSNVRNLQLSGSAIFNADNVGFKTLTVDNDLTGSGKFVFNTQLGDDNSPTDRLHVKGNATGDFNVVVNNKGGQGAVTEKGIPLIHVDLDASGASFTQTGGVPIGNYEYFLNKVNPNDWYLQASYTPDPVPEPTPEPEPTPGDEGESGSSNPPTLRPEIAGYQISPWLNANYAFTTVGSWHQRQGAWRDEHHSWGRVWGDRTRQNSDRYNYRTNTFFMQLGHDLWQSELANGNTASAGLMLTFGRLDSHANDQARLLRPGLSAATGKVKTNAWTVGGYYTQTTKEGAYWDTVLQQTFFHTDFSSASSAKQNSASTLLSVELGKPFALTDKVQLEPQLQVMGQWLKSGSSGAEGIHVKDHDQALGLGRAGLRLSYQAETVQPYVQADVMQRMGKVKGARMEGLTVDPHMQSGWWKASAGVNSQLTPTLSVYAEAEYQHGFNQGQIEGYSGNLGVKYRF